MELRQICLPPLGCFDLPAALAPASAETPDGEDFSDEFMLVVDAQASAIRRQDPQDCWLCTAEAIGQDE